MMKVATNIFLLLIFCVTSFSQNGEYLFTEILQSPNKKFAIATDFIMTEIGCHPNKSTFYKLPLDNNSKGVDVINSNCYEWSRDSELFSTQKSVENKEVNRQSVTSEIYIYDNNGSLIQTIKYGTSFLFLNSSSGIYKNEFDENGNWIAPRLIKYNLNKKTSEEYYIFSDSLSFFPEQIDLYEFPKRSDFHYGGIRTLLFKKGSPDIYYTFIVNNKNEIIFVKKGDYTASKISLPKNGFIN